MPEVINRIKQFILVSKHNGWKTAVYKTLEIFQSRLQPGATGEPEPHVVYKYKEDFNKKRIAADIAGLDYKPLISVVTPVYNIDPKWLQLAIESVKGQLYENWEMSIVDDCSPDEDLRQYLAGIDDPRIKIKLLEQNSGISGASNAALSMAGGDYVVFLDHDDELTRDALYEVVKRINETGADFVYSDEDLIDVKGNKYNPIFKPDWNPDLILFHNYITHLACIKRSLVETVGGFDSQYDGAQDYDLLLKVTENAQKIEHVPKVLYHWRSLPESTSSNPGAKVYADRAGKRALKKAFVRRDIAADVGFGNLPFHYSVSRRLTSTPLISIIIPFRDQPVMIERCVESILEKTAYANYEIIGISNNSRQEETFEIMEYLKGLDPRVSFHELNIPFNYSRINNHGVRELAAGEHVLLLNNDTEVINSNWLKALLEHSLRPEVGAVGGKLYYPDDLIQHAGVIIGVGQDIERAVAGHSHQFFGRSEAGYYNLLFSVQNVSAVTGACLMVKKALYQTLGGLEEQNLQMALNDVDFCLRLREAGYLNVFTPYCELYHHESATRGINDTVEKTERYAKEIDYMLQRHKKILNTGDPYYNPNLSTLTGGFKLKPR